MRLQTVEDAEEFAAMREEWDEVLAASRQDVPFLRHGWLLSWWRSFGEGGRLGIVTSRDGCGGLLGVLPLFAARATGRAGGVVGRFTGDLGVGSTDLTPFALPEVEDEVFAGFAAHLRSGRTATDMLELRFMDPGGPFLSRLVSEGGKVRVLRKCGLCPVVTLPDDWEAYLARLAHDRRRDVRRAFRRAHESGLTVEMVEDRAELAGAVRDLVGLIQERMRRKFGNGYTIPAGFPPFIERVTRQALDEGRLRLAFMRDGERRVAGQLRIRYGDTIYARHAAFAEGDVSRWANKALFATVVRNSIAEGARVFDLSYGDDRYKHDWGVTSVREYVAVQVYGRTPVGVARRWRDAMRNRMAVKAED